MSACSASRMVRSITGHASCRPIASKPKKLRESLWGVYRNPYTDDPSVARIDRSAANTHIYWHAGHMLMYKEDGLPYEIDPYSLATIGGGFNYNGQYKSETCSAHPKIDPVSGEMITYGYQATGLMSDDVYVYTVSPTGEITKEWRFKTPYIGIMHDIAITQKYILVPVVARTTSEARLRSGEPMWEWDCPTHIASSAIATPSGRSTPQLQAILPAA